MLGRHSATEPHLQPYIAVWCNYEKTSYSLCTTAMLTTWMGPTVTLWKRDPEKWLLIHRVVRESLLPD